MGIIKKLKSFFKIKSPYTARKVDSKDEEITFYFTIKSIKTGKFVESRKGSKTKLVDKPLDAKTFETKRDAENYMVKNNMMPRYYRAIGFFLEVEEDGTVITNIIDPSVIEPDK